MDALATDLKHVHVHCLHVGWTCPIFMLEVSTRTLDASQYIAA